MRIPRTEVSRVRLPLVADSCRAPSAPDGHVPTESLHRHIVRVHTDDGLTGLGVQLDEDALALYTVENGDDGDPAAWRAGR